PGRGRRRVAGRSRSRPGAFAGPGADPPRRRGIIPGCFPPDGPEPMNLLDLLIAPAYAQAAGAAPQGGGLSFLLMPIALIAIMYFLRMRPQRKKQKEQRGMLEKLAVGDEVITGGGIGGVVRALGDSFVTVEIADKVEIRVQKGAIAHVLPKGTLKAA